MKGFVQSHSGHHWWSGLEIWAPDSWLSSPSIIVFPALAVGRVLRSSNSSTDARWHQNAFEEKGSGSQLLSDIAQILTVGVLKFGWAGLLL